jgi:Flp pilus assembly protein TadB
MLETMKVTSATTDLHDWLLQGKDIRAGLQRCDSDNPESRLFSLLQHSLVQGVFLPSALEQAAAILREESRHQNDIVVASAQARSSARILTLLPFAVLLLLFLTSASTRSEVTTVPVLVVLALGVIFNQLGWHWVKRLVNRSALTRTGIAAHLSDEIVISLRTGISLRQSIENWALKNDPQLLHALSTGQPLSQVLQEFSLRHDSDAQLLAQILIDADRDGLPVVDTIHRLSSEMRSRRRHASEVQLRQLPTKLALPVVFCILPSFIFLSVLPLVISNLQHFQFSPPPTSITS